MGRIKGTLVKRVTKELMQLHRADFSADFEKNKLPLAAMGLQKKTRNSIAGFLARKVKQELAKKK
jgi:small subunit ribosomal protein S17e